MSWGTEIDFLGLNLAVQADSAETCSARATTSTRVGGLSQGKHELSVPGLLRRLYSP